MIWKKAESAERPIELDTTSSKTVNYVRKNIVEVKREQPDGTSMTSMNLMNWQFRKQTGCCLMGFQNQQHGLQKRKMQLLNWQVSLEGMGNG